MGRLEARCRCSRFFAYATAQGRSAGRSTSATSQEVARRRRSSICPSAQRIIDARATRLGASPCTYPSRTPCSSATHSPPPRARAHGRAVGSQPAPFTDEPALALKSLDRHRRWLDAHWLLPGHGGPWRGDLRAMRSRRCARSERAAITLLGCRASPAPSTGGGRLAVFGLARRSSAVAFYLPLPLLAPLGAARPARRSTTRCCERVRRP